MFQICVWARICLSFLLAFVEFENSHFCVSEEVWLRFLSFKISICVSNEDVATLIGFGKSQFSVVKRGVGVRFFKFEKLNFASAKCWSRFLSFKDSILDGRMGVSLAL